MSGVAPISMEALRAAIVASKMERVAWKRAFADLLMQYQTKEIFNLAKVEITHVVICIILPSLSLADQKGTEHREQLQRT